MNKYEFLTIVKKFIKELELLLVPYHDASDHSYQDDPNQLGICVCGWFSMESSLREAAESLLSKLKTIQLVLENGNQEDIDKIFDEFAIVIQIYQKNNQQFPFRNFPTISLN
ncbi:MAG TPA: hypothetical protein PLS49_00540 [Candidatus Woesebacteria bacterium]|nr:hypothetical protein [Candidatus Woesebacteria bacterium]